MTRDEIRQAARGLDPARALEFERSATHLARRLGEDALDAALAAAGDGDESPAVRVFAATTGIALCRRLQRPEDAQRVLLALRHWFDALPVVVHLRSLVSMLVGTDESVRSAVESAEAAYRLMPDNPGVVHTLAWALVESAERDGSPADDARYERALAVVDEAIDLLRLVPEDDRAIYRGRFFHTRARIRRRRGEYAAARADIQHAIDLEDRQAPDYFVRISEYVVERSLLAADRSLRELESSVDRAARRLEAAELGTVGAVGFVAATIGLIQIAIGESQGGRPFWQALALVATFGVVLFVAVAFGVRALRRAHPGVRRG